MKSLSRDAIQRMVGGEIGSAGSGGGEGTSLAGYASQAWVNENYLSIEFFSKLFKAYDSAATPNEIVPNDVESTITNIKAMFGLWTDEYLSALGLNSGGGGGGSDTLARLLDVELSIPTDNQVLTYYNGKWRNMASQGGINMTTVWSALGDNSTTEQIAASHLTTALNGYALTSQIPTDNAQLTNGAGYITGIDSSMIITALGYTPVSSSGITGTFWGQSWTNGGTVFGSIDSGSNGGKVYGFHSIELNSYASVSGYGGYIDFHYNGSSLDYTSRIIEASLGVISIIARSSTITDRYAGLVVGSGFDGSYIQIGDGMIVWDATNNALKVQKSDGTAAGFYSLGFVSALGANSGGGGGGGSSLNEPLVSINSAGLGAPSSFGQTLVWDGSAWKYSTATQLRASSLSISNNISGYSLQIGASAEIAGTMTITAGSHIIQNGKIAIGYSAISSTYRFYCKDNGYISGTLTQGSDMRRKNYLGDITTLSVDAVANAPVFRFTWKDSTDEQVHAGTSAQYWQAVLPQTVLPIDEGFLSMDYGATALIAAVITAKKVIDHERRIADLERENRELKNELRNLKAA